MRKSLMFCALLCGCLTMASAQNRASGSNPYQQDFLHYTDEIERTHPGYGNSPLPFAVLGDWENLKRETLSLLEDVPGRYDFFMIMSRFIGKLQDGHSNIYFDEPEELLLPFDFGIIDGELYIINVYDDAYGDMLYTSLAALNGWDAAGIIGAAKEYVSADSGNTWWSERVNSTLLRSLREKRFLEYLGFSRGDSLEWEYRVDGGTELRRVRFMGINPENGIPPRISGGRNAITGVKSVPYFFSYDEGINGVYVQLNSLPPKVDRGFLRKVFRECRDRGAERLVLDLRNNSGGNSQWCLEFFRHIVDRRTSLSLYTGWKRAGEENESFLSSHTVSPRRPQFDGEVYILAGGKTMSSANFFVIAALDNHLATVIGTPTGNNNVRYGYTKRIVLPNTNLVCTSSVRIWQRTLCDRGDYDKPITPDYLVGDTIESYRENRDPPYDFLRELIGDSSP